MMTRSGDYFVAIKFLIYNGTMRKMLCAKRADGYTTFFGGKMNEEDRIHAVLDERPTFSRQELRNGGHREMYEEAHLRPSAYDESRYALRIKYKEFTNLLVLTALKVPFNQIECGNEIKWLKLLTLQQMKSKCPYWYFPMQLIYATCNDQMDTICNLFQNDTPFRTAGADSEGNVITIEKVKWFNDPLTS